MSRGLLTFLKALSQVHYPQFPFYLRNSENLSHQTSQSSWIFYIKRTWKDQLFKTVCRLQLTTGFAGPKSSRDIQEPGPCRIALSWMHAALNKQHRVSPKTSRKLDHYLWREIQTIVIISCSPYSTNRAGLNSNPILI